MTDDRGMFHQAPNQTTIVDDADALAAAQNALQAAQAAMARANSAMQRANTAATDAGNANVTLGQLQAAQAAADAVHDALDARDELIETRLDTIQLTPGTPGENGKSAYQIARDHGYGGTETQWLATLHGADGNPGTPGNNATVVIASGWTSTPLLALGQQQDLTITLSRTMPNTTYNVELNMPTALLGVSVITVKSKTTTTVVVTLKANVAIGASSLGVTTWTSQ